MTRVIPRIPRSLSLPAVAGVLLLLPAATHGAELSDVLARMDRAAANFRGLTASIRLVSYTALVKETSEEKGLITIYRPKPKDMRMLVEITEPSPRAVAYQGRKVQMYYPKLAVVREYDLGKQSSLVDQYLLLGFGTPSSDLKKSYTIKLTGEETLNGVKCDRLELVPLSSEAVKQIRMFEIWVSQQDGIVVQQKLHQPSRDYMLFSYSDVKLNPALTDNSVRLKVPKGVKKETPQK